MTTTTIRLNTAVPFDGPGQFRYLAGHAVPGVESGDAAGFRRQVRMPHGVCDLELVLVAPTVVACTVRSAGDADLPALLTRVRRLLDLDADSSRIDAALARDRALAPAVRECPGVRVPGALDAEECLFRTLIGQQISVAAARTVTGNLVRALCGDSGLFPSAAEIASGGRAVLRGPARRIATILGAAEALASGALCLHTPDGGDLTVPELTARLVALPGVGPWTAGYVALRTLPDSDVLLGTDLVLLQGAARLGLPDTAKGIADYGRRWAPWRGYAGMRLWRAARSVPA